MVEFRLPKNSRVSEGKIWEKPVNASNVKEIKIDMMSLSAHKFYGPKGVGALFVRKGINLKTILNGGGQELNLRPGTENIAGIAGLGLALSI